MPSLNFFKSLGTAFNVPTSKGSTFAFKLFKLVGTLVSLLMSDLLASVLKVSKYF